jgi:HTH-type transcriptional regulator/antitoxin HigA
VIRTEEECELALARIDELMDAEPGTPEMDELELLSVLVARYEDERYPMDLPDPIAAITFRMEQQGLTRKDLEPYLGSQARVSEVLSGKRSLSKEMIRRLHAGLGIPAEVLLQERDRAEVEPGLHGPLDGPHHERPGRGYAQSDGTLHPGRAVAEQPRDSDSDVS